MYVRAPWCAAAAAIASRSATRPSADWTALTATSAVSASIASATRSSGTSSTCTPRASAASNGNRTEVKSSSAHTTRSPRSSESATRPVNADTCALTATSSAATPCRRAKLARGAATERSQPS